MENGTTYSFTVIAIDQSDNESSGVSIDATPIGTLESFDISVNTTGDIKQGVPFSVTITALDQGGEPFTVEQDTNLNLTVNPTTV